MRIHWTLLPIIVVGVAVGTLIALYIAAQVAQQQLNSSTTGALLNAL